jgi:hypothetical protein
VQKVDLRAILTVKKT